MPRTLRKVSCCPANEASGQVLGGGAGPHRERRPRSSLAGQLLVGGPDVGLEVRRERLARPPPRGSPRPTAASARDVVGVQAAQLLGDPVRPGPVSPRNRR